MAAKINAIGPVDENSGDKIKDARNAFDALTPEQQEIINNAAKECSEYCFDVFDEKTEEAKQLLIDAGIEFYDVDVDAYRACVDKYFELSNFSDGVQETLDNLMAEYRANH